jgi:hypothetical protein
MFAMIYTRFLDFSGNMTQIHISDVTAKEESWLLPSLPVMWHWYFLCDIAIADFCKLSINPIFFN